MGRVECREYSAGFGECRVRSVKFRVWSVEGVVREWGLGGTECKPWSVECKV